MTVQQERVRRLNDTGAARGRYVLYWMQQSQRAQENHAFEYAAERANALGLPLVVGFGLTGAYPGANRRHYRFLLEGLRETADGVAARGARFVLRRGDPADVALELAREAALVVADRGYLRHQRAWRDQLAARAGREVVEVEADAVVPIDVVSQKKEYAARTLRPRLQRNVRAFLVPVEAVPIVHDAGGLDVSGEPLDDLDGLLDRLGLDGSVPEVPQHFRGGTSEAKTRVARFVRERLVAYAADSNQPQRESVSQLSPYLHFGQLSPLWVALQIHASPLVHEAGGVAFLEQLLVRRELSLNYCWHEPRYDTWEALPEWARKTLLAHLGDEREHVYTEAELEACGTHDPYWNATMLEMKATGYMHNYMRMYWAKKVLEWTPDPREALKTLVRLNDRWFLDGRDPNSYAGVLWTFGLHDRPWGERPIFGTVRYMSAGGLERKCDIRGYVDRVRSLAAG